MNQADPVYQRYLQILREELQPAFGCTEPAALAYAAALASDLLGMLPERMEICCSGNIIKNVKSVIVPNAGGGKGLQLAAAAGVIAGHPERKLELLSSLTDADRAHLGEYLRGTEISVSISDCPNPFDIQVTAYAEGNRAYVRLTGGHTNVVRMEYNGKVLLDGTAEEKESAEGSQREMRVDSVLDFADSVELKDIEDILERQISYNTAIAREGISRDYGANIGAVLLKRDSSLRTRMMAMAAAGSDARMNGCEMPVIINSGSGNQGITVTVPLVVYAEEKKIPKEKLYRALALSNLLAIYQRSGIGCLSAYCGAINAGVAAACGIVYLDGGRLADIAHTLVNGLAIVSGIICDGAKASCASKIAIAIDAGMLGYEMYQNGQQFYRGDGIVKGGVDLTIDAVARLGRDGMRETDREILHIMIDE